ncbi:MAG: hypothetical protein LBS91_04730 [Clostridiales Family XIII bacterium]|nr:hypothetical protein [Clostridiales Family XIII bacterium]
MMDGYLSHISAAKLWGVPYLDAAIGSELATAFASGDDVAHDAAVDFMPEAVSTRAAQVPAAELEIRLPSVCRTFRNEKSRNRKAAVKSYVASRPLPKGAVVWHRGVRVANPELLFLELATTLGFHRTLLLGLSLCGHPNRHPEKALSSAKKILRFAEKAAWHRGNLIALRAARHLADGSASVMESLLYMILVLPHHYGGYGLKGAKFNFEISLAGKDAALGKKSLNVDLYWEDAKLAVEYDSYAYHANVNRWVHDARRLTAIENMGFNTISVNTAQIYDTKAMEEVARLIAGHLKKRIQIRDGGFLRAQAHLRALLPQAAEKF